MPKHTNAMAEQQAEPAQSTQSNFHFDVAKDVLRTPQPFEPRVTISRSALLLAQQGLVKVEAKIRVQVESVAAALKTGADPVSITEEELRVAKSGLEMMIGEAQGHMADVSAVLEPPRRLNQRTRALIATGEVIEYQYKKVAGNSTAQKVWANDPDSLYQHSPTGEIRLTRDGSPVKRPRLTPQGKERLRETAAYARQVKEQKRLGGSGKSAPILKR